MNDQRFTFLCTKDERVQLTKLAAHCQRSQSDTIRFLIRQAIQDISNDSQASMKVYKNTNKREKLHERSL
jgi:hypothetical protein